MLQVKRNHVQPADREKNSSTRVIKLSEHVPTHKSTIKINDLIVSPAYSAKWQVQSVNPVYIPAQARENKRSIVVGTGPVNIRKDACSVFNLPKASKNSMKIYIC